MTLGDRIVPGTFLEPGPTVAAITSSFFFFGFSWFGLTWFSLVWGFFFLRALLFMGSAVV